MMTEAQVIETSVNVANSLFQNHTQPDDHTQPTYDTTPQFNIEQYFLTTSFIMLCKVVLACVSIDQILQFDHSNEKTTEEHLLVLLFIMHYDVDEIPKSG